MIKHCTFKGKRDYYPLIVRYSLVCVIFISNFYFHIRQLFNEFFCGGCLMNLKKVKIVYKCDRRE